MGAICGSCAWTRGLTLRSFDGTGSPTGFAIVERIETPAILVAPATPTSRLAVFSFPSSAAVVAGSTQRLETLDAREISARSLEIVRRRSGGGAVLVAPQAQVWLDLFVPAKDPLFTSDVIRASAFVGDLWRSCLVDLLGNDLPIRTHGGPVVQSRWSRVWCFSGLGPGEVTRGEKKIVGLSQRRNRDGAWFFTMALTEFDAERDASLVSGDVEDRRALTEELRQHVTTLAAPLDDVVARLKEGISRL